MLYVELFWDAYRNNLNRPYRLCPSSNLRQISNTRNYEPHSVRYFGQRFFYIYFRYSVRWLDEKKMLFANSFFIFLFFLIALFQYHNIKLAYLQQNVYVNFSDDTYKWLSTGIFLANPLQIFPPLVNSACCGTFYFFLVFFYILDVELPLGKFSFRITTDVVD